MDIIELTRKLGHAIQEDERYIAYNTARQASDDDDHLQQLIGDFNLKRLAISNEAGTANPDNEKLQGLNNELRSVYAEIMSNEHMKAYDNAKTALDELLQRVNAIISQSAEGENPDTADYDPSASCGGDCSSCGGCH